MFNNKKYGRCLRTKNIEDAKNKTKQKKKQWASKKKNKGSPIIKKIQRRSKNKTTNKQKLKKQKTSKNKTKQKKNRG